VSLAPPLPLAIAICAALGLMAIAGLETRRPALVAIGKPGATLALLLLVGIPPVAPFGWLIAGGILFSVVGDIALLGDGDREFLVGTAAFLIAHVFYSAAFLGVASWTRFPAASLAVVAFSAVLVTRLWPALGKMRIPVAIYAAAITVMVIAAFAAWRGPLPRWAAASAALGSLLFYLSDASLAWNRFRRPLPHAGIITLTSYWAGQIGIALAARWQG
jgi:uncharacterized membrane protein YhhN